MYKLIEVGNCGASYYGKYAMDVASPEYFRLRKLERYLQTLYCYEDWDTEGQYPSVPKNKEAEFAHIEKQISILREKVNLINQIHLEMRSQILVFKSGGRIRVLKPDFHLEFHS